METTHKIHYVSSLHIKRIIAEEKQRSFYLEVITGVEPAMTVLQTVALPLGYITIIKHAMISQIVKQDICFFLDHNNVYNYM